MKIDDVNLFKGKIKTGIQEWGNNMIDDMFKGKATTKQFAKNGLNNLLSRNDDKINGWVDKLFLFVADDSGTIDSDVMVDTFVGILCEMEKKEYDLGVMMSSIGNGEVAITFPRNLLTDMFIGDKNKVVFTREDLTKLKDFIN